MKSIEVEGQVLVIMLETVWKRASKLPNEFRVSLKMVNRSVAC